MHALAVVILTGLLLSVQTVLGPKMAVLGARPDWLLVFVVFIGLYAAAPRAVIVGWFVGLCADLMSIERLGVMSLSYGLVTLVLVVVRGYLFRHSVLTQAGVTFLLCLLLWAAWYTYASLLYTFRGAISHVLLVALYTAALAPLVHGVLLRAGPLIGVPRPRRGPLGFQPGYTDV